MKKYDIIIIGSGAGLNLVGKARQMGMKVALIDDGPLGGTCLNRGCIPTKVMIHPADIIREMQEAENVGIHGKVTKVDFKLIMERTNAIVSKDVKGIERGVANDEGTDFYNTVAKFVGKKVIDVDGKKITAPKILIVSGARPLIPRIKGLEDVGYLTNRNIWQIKQPPKKLLIVGGGYIAVEFAHFFSAIGCDVTILGRNPNLVKSYYFEIGEVLKKKFSKYMKVHTNIEVVEAKIKGGKKVLIGVDRETGKKKAYKGDEILVAAGRRSNADLLKPAESGVKVDRQGWVIVNEFLETNVKDIWAFGDATGKHMFRHTANYESQIVSNAVFHDRKLAVDEHAIPHAVFTYPQIAGVGMSFDDAMNNYKVVGGKYPYLESAMGYAINDKDCFVMVYCDAETRKILGAQAIGPSAAELVQQVCILMNAEDGTYMPLSRTQTIHPAISEVLLKAFANMIPLNFEQEHHDHDHHHGHKHHHGHAHHHGHDHHHGHKHD